MNETGTSQDTGPVALSTEDAAERIAALLDPPEDTDDGETQEAEASEQAQSEEQSEEPAEESETEEETGSEPQPPADDTPVTVKVNGEDVQVTLHELKRGFLREQDYTRKTQELSEQRQAVRQERDDYARYIGLLKEKLAGERDLYTEQELADLRYTDPAEWAARSRENDNWRVQRQQQIRLIEQEQERVRSEQAEEARTAFIETVQAENARLLEALPEWRDDAKREAELAELRQHLGKMGFGPEELSMVADHRLVLLARDAMLYRKAATRVPAAVQKAREVALRPGAKSQAPSKVSDVTRAKQRLAKTGRVDDAAAVIERLMG